MAVSNLQTDLIIDILLCLPVKSLVRFRCVCKSWNALITSPTFASMHLKRSNTESYLLVKQQPVEEGFDIHYSLYHDKTFNNHMTIQFPQQSGDSSSSKTPLKLVGSCNGLLCLFDSENIFLFNPAVDKFKVIPNSGVSSSMRVVFGFGFLAEINDYKLVRLLYNRKEFDGGDNGGTKVPRPQVEVYKLSTNSWKMIEHDISCFINIYASGAVLNVVVHWEASLIMDGNDAFILAFDMNAEAFRHIKPPKICYNCDDGLHGFIGVFEGCLSIFSFHDRGRGDQHRDWDIWVMKEYGVADSWTKLLTIEWSLGISHPLRFAKSGKLLAVSNCGGLVLYDQKHR